MRRYAMASRFAGNFESFKFDFFPRNRLGCMAQMLVTPAGFEPTTCPLGGGCSIQLSHGAMGPVIA